MKQYIESTIFIENELTKQSSIVPIMIDVRRVTHFYSYPKELDTELEGDATKIYFDDDVCFTLLMNYEEFKIQYFEKLSILNIVDRNIKSN